MAGGSTKTTDSSSTVGSSAIWGFAEASMPPSSSFPHPYGPSSLSALMPSKEPQVELLANGEVVQVYLHWPAWGRVAFVDGVGLVRETAANPQGPWRHSVGAAE